MGLCALRERERARDSAEPGREAPGPLAKAASTPGKASAAAENARVTLRVNTGEASAR